ncbi:MAG: FAD:protein FMN transferase [Bifidobacterium aquikefiri]|uniref:FAD:protein FMN transferase n=1 Tax=Bifidobacterium aquikefiri TaxID=1653207 RepID=UPI0039E93451
MSVLSHIVPFPKALGTGIIIAVDQLPAQDFHDVIAEMIEKFEIELSRFRDDSTVSAMAHAKHGGTFDFSATLTSIFEIYDALYSATAGAIDPLVGADLVRLGYGPDLSFQMQPDALAHNGAAHGRPCWAEAVERDGSMLRTHRAVQLDFGAVGKGFIVDVIADQIADQCGPQASYVIDACGDLRIHTSQPQSIALEDPLDTTRAVGTASVSDASFCASAPSRRHWFVKDPNYTNAIKDSNTSKESANESHRSSAAQSIEQSIDQSIAKDSHLLLMHHLLNAIDGKPARSIAATWVQVAKEDNPENVRNHPTAWADGISTALFVTNPNDLASRLADEVTFDCAILNAQRQASTSEHFPGTFFTHE